IPLFAEPAFDKRFLVRLIDGVELDAQAAEQLDDVVGFPTAALKPKAVRQPVRARDQVNQTADVFFAIARPRATDQSVAEVEVGPACFDGRQELPAPDARAEFV